MKLVNEAVLGRFLFQGFFFCYFKRNIHCVFNEFMGLKRKHFWAPLFDKLPRSWTIAIIKGLLVGR